MAPRIKCKYCDEVFPAGVIFCMIAHLKEKHLDIFLKLINDQYSPIT